MTKNKATSLLSEILQRHGLPFEIGEYGLPEVPISDDSFVAIYISPKWSDSKNGFILSVKQGIRRTSSDLSSDEMRVAAYEIARSAAVVDEINAANIVFDDCR